MIALHVRATLPSAAHVWHSCSYLFFLCFGVASRAASVSSAAALAASHRAKLCLVLSLASKALAIAESAAATSCWPAGVSHGPLSTLRCRESTGEVAHIWSESAAKVPGSKSEGRKV